MKIIREVVQEKSLNWLQGNSFFNLDYQYLITKWVSKNDELITNMGEIFKLQKVERNVWMKFDNYIYSHN